LLSVEGFFSGLKYESTRLFNLEGIILGAFEQDSLGSPEWLLINHPDWPKRVKTCMTTRLGGVSGSPFESFNLGSHVGDDPQKVAQNRDLLAQSLGIQPLFLNQVHGNHVHEIGAHAGQGAWEASAATVINADACFTKEVGAACTIMVADCLPVLLTDRGGSFVAAAHAGWRGLSGVGCLGNKNVLESLRDALIQKSLLRAENMKDCIAWLGPCIGPKEFEVGEEVKSAFNSLKFLSNSQLDSYFVPITNNHEGRNFGAIAPKWWANLAGLARLNLNSMGVHQVLGNDGTDKWCTLKNVEQFFSHRRDKRTGRQAALIWIN